MITLPRPVRPLPSTSLYVTPFVRSACSMQGCAVHAIYGNAAGTWWCVHHYRRYLLVERLCLLMDRHTTREAIARSALGAWIVFARCGKDAEIEQACSVMEVA